MLASGVLNDAHYEQAAGMGRAFFVVSVADPTIPEYFPHPHVPAGGRLDGSELHSHAQKGCYAIDGGARHPQCDVRVLGINPDFESSTRTRTHKHTCPRIKCLLNAHTHARTHARTHAYAPTHTHTPHTYIHARKHTYTRTATNAHTHTCARISTVHTHTHTHKHLSLIHI